MQLAYRRHADQTTSNIRVSSTTCRLVFGNEADPSVGTGLPQLAARADEIHAALAPDRIAARMRTTAAMATHQGTVVLASGGRDLSRAQRALGRPNELLARSPEAHAEITALKAAYESGLTPKSMAVTRGICPACQQAIEETGGRLVSRRGAVW